MTDQNSGSTVKSTIHQSIPDKSPDIDTIRKAARDNYDSQAQGALALPGATTPGHPIDVNDVLFAIYQHFFYQFIRLAHKFTFYDYPGVDVICGGHKYRYVQPKYDATGISYPFKGPGYAPIVEEGNPDDPRRLTIWFDNIRVIGQGVPDLFNATFNDQPNTSLAEFLIDNSGNETPSTSQLSVTYFKSSSTTIATSSDWSDQVHTDLSGTATVNCGVGMFPQAAFSVTVSGGLAASTGGSTTRSLSEYCL